MRYTIFTLIQIISLTLIGQTIMMPSVPENGVSYMFDQIEDNSEPKAFNDEGPWDFSSVKPSTTYEMKLLPISHSSLQADYPKATHFIKSQNGEFFYSYEGNEIHNHGRKTDNTDASYSDAVLWMKFPLTSTSQFTDEIESDFIFNRFPGNVKDKSVSQVLGASTLVLPDGTKYNNAILVRTIKTLDGEVGRLTATIKEEGKYWWVPGIALPIVAFEKFYLDDDIQYERSSFLKAEKLLSVNPLSQKTIDFYPNPAKHKLTINLTSKSEVSIFDLQGKIVYQEVLSAGNQTFNVENHPSGKYVLTVNDFNTVKRQIFLKQ
jgi:hypothetical protein